MGRSRKESSGVLGGRKKRVAIVLDLDWPYRRQVDLFEGIHEYAEAHADWECRLLPIAEVVPGGAEYPTEGESLSCDGIIARVTPELAVQAKREGIPLINVWFNSPVTDGPTVIPDFRAIGRLAAGHLLSRGVRHLGFLGFQRDRACREEFSAMREVAVEHGATASRLLIRHSYNRNTARWNEFQQQMQGWIGGWSTPFGVVATSDLLARYAVEVCRQQGLRVPEDVAVIGNGDDHPICLQPAPSLSSVDCGFKMVGFQAAEALDRLMDGKALLETILRFDHLRIVPRRSTDVFAVEDVIVAEALRYIAEHCQEPINVGDVVDHLPASRRSLERRFARALDRSVAQEITRMRVQRLERLLVESDEPLEALAPQCGFSDTAQMRRNFFQCRGMNPSAFRAEHRTPGWTGLTEKGG